MLDVLYSQFDATLYNQGPVVISLNMLFRMVFAVFVGGIIGLERKYKKKPAGMITSIFVCLGATIVAVTQELLIIRSMSLLAMHPELQQAIKVDVGRMSAQVVSGIGFLGAGVIIYNQNKISGITTATILWVLACIGLLIGHGYLFMSFILTMIIMFTLIIIRKLEMNIFIKRKKSKSKNYNLEE